MTPTLIPNPADPTKLPRQLGGIHFIGIGGIGMSGIAEVLMNHGYKVQGSDIKTSKITDRLQSLGAKIFTDQKAGNVTGAEVIVVSSAIQPDNAELMEARRTSIPVVRRAEMLSELMRLKSNIAVAGTHGKTTTTTMVATLLESSNMDPTVINGGIIHAFGSNARMGLGEWMVVEADESDGTFVKLPATIAMVTNIDSEHMEHYGSFEALLAAFEQFISNIPFYGVGICNTDHEVVQNLVGRMHDRRIISYGFNLQADVRAENLIYRAGNSHFDVIAGKRRIAVALPMPGAHNVSNALGAIALAIYLGLTDEQIQTAFANFKGVNRRFTHIGDWNGVMLIDDYAHHPVEIRAVLDAARQVTKGRVLAVHQPHRFSRLFDLFEDFCTCFNQADCVGICDVYSAGESPIKGASQADLLAGLRDHGHRGVFALDGKLNGAEGLAKFVKTHAQSGDMVICLGAGSISTWANDLPQELAKLDKK